MLKYVCYNKFPNCLQFYMEVIMKDKRAVKMKQHYYIFLNDIKFKVLSCKINKENDKLIIKTKVRGQHFPTEKRILARLQIEEPTMEICVEYLSMSNDEKIEHWEYKIIK